jgi:hypothetical protein
MQFRIRIRNQGFKDGNSTVIQLEKISYIFGKKLRSSYPLLTNETEVNWDSMRANERGPSLVGSLGLSCRARYKSNFWSALADLVGPVQSIFPRRTLFQFVCPHCPASLAGRRAGWLVS